MPPIATEPKASITCPAFPYKSISLVELTFKASLNRVEIRSIVGNDEYSRGSVVYRQTRRIITDRDMFIMSKKSRSGEGTGMTIMATISITPIARTISLFFNTSASLIFCISLYIPLFFSLYTKAKTSATAKYNSGGIM